MHHDSSTPNVICEHCETPFRVPPARLGKAKFCRPQCYQASRQRIPVPVGDGTAAVPLTRGMEAVIDAADVPMVAQYTWFASEQGDGRFYARASLDWKPSLYLHRYLMGVEASDVIVDHVNGDTLDNRRSNLRIATNSENGMNSRRKGQGGHGYKGVTRNKYRWSASIRANRVRYHLGTFDTPEEAARAYDAKARELHGDFARLNFPD